MPRYYITGTSVAGLDITRDTMVEALVQFIAGSGGEPTEVSIEILDEGA